MPLFWKLKGKCIPSAKITGMHPDRTLSYTLGDQTANPRGHKQKIDLLKFSEYVGDLPSYKWKSSSCSYCENNNFRKPFEYSGSLRRNKKREKREWNIKKGFMSKFEFMVYSMD